MVYARASIMVAAITLAWACGGDDGGGDGSADNAQATMPATGTTPPAGSDTTAGMTGTAGMTAIDPQQLMDLAEMFLPDCDPNVPTTATCGGTACPAPTMLTAALCVVPCCAQMDGAEVCGTRSSDITMPDSVCMPPPPPGVEDPNCPMFDAGNGTVLPGCCTDTAVCGVISSISGACITESPFIMLPATPPPCDGSGLTAPDAGPMASPDGGMDAPDGGMDAPDAGAGG